MKRVLIAISLLLASPAFAVYVPPVGIPTPPFGIDEVAPAVPDPWDNQTAGFYYVCEDCPGSTDTGRTYGTPAAPRKTIPTVIPVGSVVELHGTYTKDHTNSPHIAFQGTAEQPCFIRGVDNGVNMPTATRTWTLKGSYGVVENIHFNGAGTGTTIKMQTALTASSDHLSFRYNEISGDAATTSSAMVFQGSISDNTFWARNCVAYRNTIHDIGDTSSTEDNDLSGISAFARADNVWMLENDVHDVDGAGTYAYSGGVGLNTYPTNVFMGANHIYRTRQTGVGVKGSTDVVASSNHIHHIFDRKDALGAVASESKGMTYQYSPERVWFINNDIHDCYGGIYAAGNAGTNYGQSFYMVGNKIYNISFNPASTVPLTNQNAYTAIMLNGGYNRYIINNTMDNISAGIHLPSSATVHIIGNIFGRIDNVAGRDIVADSTPAVGSTVDYNLFRTDNAVLIRWGAGGDTDLATFQSAKGLCDNCIEADPGFDNAAAHNYALTASSAAIDNGVVSSVYGTFQDLYGVSIATDIAGTSRPRDATFDIGAYEYGGEIPADNTAPSKPGNMTATALGPTSIRVTWDASTDAVGVVGYFLYRGGVHYQTVYGTTFTDGGLTPETEYVYAVEAFDAAGNVSADSDPASATTTPYPVLLRGTVRGRMQ